jgi:putative transposase
MHRSIRTTNAIESLWSLVHQRTTRLTCSRAALSCLTIVWATIQGIRLHRVTIE